MAGALRADVTRRKPPPPDPGHALLPDKETPAVVRKECRGLGFIYAEDGGCVDPATCRATWICKLNDWPRRLDR